MLPGGLKRAASIAALLAHLSAQHAYASDCIETAARRLDLGDSLTATLQDGSIVPGHFVGVTDDGTLVLREATIELGTGPRQIRPELLRDLRFRDRTRPTVLYAVTGLVVGSAIAASIARRDSRGGELSGLGVGFAALGGGVLGILVGLAFPLSFPYARLVECK